MFKEFVSNDGVATACGHGPILYVDGHAVFCAGCDSYIDEGAEFKVTVASKEDARDFDIKTGTFLYVHHAKCVGKFAAAEGPEGPEYPNCDEVN